MSGHFCQLTRMHYAESTLRTINTPGFEDDIMLLVPDKNGRHQQITFEFQRIQRNNELIATLRVCEDSWLALASLGNLLRDLDELRGWSITPLQVCNLLLQHGFEDTSDEPLAS